MKKKIAKTVNNSLTVKQLQHALRPILYKLKTQDKRFNGIDDRFKRIDDRFKRIDDRFDIVETKMEIIDRRFVNMNIRLDNVEKSIMASQKIMNERFNALDNHIDAFLKRTEENEREILFFGHQHDNLAKFCTEKIGYPPYGRIND